MSPRHNVHYALRSTLHPSVHIPIGARSAGHYLINRDFTQHNLIKNVLELFWGISGCIAIRRDQETFELRQNEVGFLFPGERHDYIVLEDETKLCWLTFDGARCADMKADYKLSDKIFFAGRCPQEMFAQLEAEIREIGGMAQYTAAATALNILHMALRGVDITQDIPILVKQFKHMVTKRFHSTDCGVDGLATELGVHRGTLHRIFTEFTGTSPSEYISGVRLRNAIDLLRSGYSVTETAKRCGYANANYLAKVMRRVVGLSPHELKTDSSSALDNPGTD